MKEVAEFGLQAARHLRGEIYEVRVELGRRKFRVLCAQVAKFILLALSGFSKGTRKAPLTEIELAESRLADWRARGKKGRARP
jgi:phage-related protein